MWLIYFATAGFSKYLVACLSLVLVSTTDGYLLSMADRHAWAFPIILFNLLLNAAWIAPFNGGPARMSEKTILPNRLASLSLLLSAIYVWVSGRRITDAGGVFPLVISPFERRSKELGSERSIQGAKEDRCLL